MVYNFAVPNAEHFDDGGVVDVALPEGDYTALVNGESLSICIERKSLADYFMSVGRERDEVFVPRLARMSTYTYAAVIIEASPQHVRAGFERSKVSGLAAWVSALHWGVQYGIHFHFAGNWAMGRLMCQRLLEEFAFHHHLGQDLKYDK